MKYYSELLKKTYDSEKDCLKAEKEYNEKLEAEEKRKKELTENRKARAKEVEEAYKAVCEAQKHYNELRNQFVRDYGSFHMTFSSDDDNWNTLFEDWFKIF